MCAITGSAAATSMIVETAAAQWVRRRRALWAALRAEAGPLQGGHLFEGVLIVAVSVCCPRRDLGEQHSELGGVRQEVGVLHGGHDVGSTDRRGGPALLPITRNRARAYPYFMKPIAV
jgi:hypothetical protein